MVFGEGPADARILMVGEQPGDQEDLAGHPFVGPAGQMLNRALVEAGVDRGKVYVTNAVKHFKFELRGRRRIHEKPGVTEINACRHWLDLERAEIKPALTIMLGATAARALLGRPPLLILDEPSSHLDDETTARLLVNLRDLEWSPAVLLITHDPAVARMADRVVELRDGRVPAARA